MSKISKPRLGRGLSSLLSISDAGAADLREPLAAPASMPNEVSTATPPNPPINSIVDLPIHAITPNPHQPRQDFDLDSLTQLAQSLQNNGVIQPILVRPVQEGYELVAGERRLRAAKLAGFVNIPAIVKEIDPLSQAQLALVENIQRQDLNPIDRAQAYQLLMSQLTLTQAELAARLGEDRSTIGHFLRLLELPDKITEYLRNGKLSLGHAKLLAGNKVLAEQLALADKVASEGLSVRALEQLMAPAKESLATHRPSLPPTPHLTDLAKTFTHQLGMRVEIRNATKKGRGKLIIHYTTLDQFDDLKERLGVDVDEV